MLISGCRRAYLASMAAGGRRQEAGGRRQEAGGRRQEAYLGLVIVS